MKRCAALILGLALGGCDDEAPMEEDDGEELSRCEEEMRDEAFHLGLEKSGAVMRVTFTDAEPSAPVRGFNTWTIGVTDLAGAPIEDPVLSVRLWMPDHGHGSPQPVGISPTMDGEYELDPVNLHMAGYCEVTISAEMDDTTDSAMVPICVE